MYDAIFIPLGCIAFGAILSAVLSILAFVIADMFP
jgi:hypothetical protein